MMEGNIYMIQFTDQDWVDFRLAELHSLLELHGIPSGSPQLKQPVGADSLGTGSTLNLNTMTGNISDCVCEYV
jgi:hypothetical protein